MPIYTLSDLRRVAGQAGVTGSDEFLIKDYADRAGLDPVHVANKLGYDGGASTLTKERIAGGIDNYQSGWWETGAALANGLGLDGVKNYAERKAADNRFQAEVAGARARQLGGIDSYEDVDGISSGLNYLGGLAAQSIPYAAEAAVGGWVGRGIGATAKGLQLASRAGRAADATQDMVTAGRAAEAALGRRGMVGATVASYPSSVGDILGNQREQIEANGGEMDYGSAFAGGVPYSLLNGALGIEGTLGRGQMARSGVRLLDDMTGIRGIAARTGASVGRQMAEEGTSELGQEFANQYFGRMAVDPNETFYNDESGKRFRESFVGGAALGGAFGAVGGHRRSQDYYDRQREKVPNPDQSTPREDSYEEPGPVRQLGYSPLAGTPIVFPDGTVTLDGEQELLARFPNQVEPARGLNTARVGVASDPSVNIDRAGTAAINYDDTQALQDPGAELGRQRYLEQREQQQRLDKIKKAALARAEEIKVQEAAAKEFGIKGSKGVGLFVELTDLHKGGTITDGELSENLALLSNSKNGAVDRWIRATVEHRANQAEVSKAEIEAPINNLKAQAEAKNVSKRVPNVAQAPVDGGRGGVVNAGSQPAGGPGVVPGAVGSADTTAGTPAPGATGVAVRAGGGDTGAVSPGMKLVAGLEKRNGRALTQQEKTRLFLSAGLDSAGFPVGRKLTYDEVAAVESDQSGGKQVKRAAISKQMLGIGVSEKLIHAFADRVSASNADETDTINDAVETDDGVLAVQDQPEFDTKPTADEVSFGAAAQQMVDTGMQVQAGTSMSGAGGTAREIVKNLRLLLGDKNSNLSEPQRKAIGLVITSDANLDSPDGEKAEQTATRVIKRAQQLLQRTDVFSPGELAVLKAVVGSTKGENVEARTRSVVEEKREEAKGPDPELVARNEAIIAQNAKLIEELNADLTEEGELRSKAKLVREIIGPEPDTNTIADAASSWDEDLSAGDPKWVTLSAVEQGGWINTWVAYETGELNAQGLAREYGAQLDKAKLQRANGPADADTGKPAGATGGAVPGSRTRSAVEQNLPVGPSDAGEKGSTAGAETQAGTGNRLVTPPTITVKKRRTIVKPEPDGTKFSADRAGSGSTVDELYAEFAELGIRPNNRKVTVVQSVADVPQSMRKSVDNKSKVTASRVAAFVSGDRAWFIADNIAPGTGRALFMHEVGSHLGLDNLLTEDQLDNLFSTIIKWADRNDGTMESNLARQAIIRAGVAVTHDEQLQSEVMAYFVEEAVKAGIDPTAMSYKNELARWFRTIYAAFKSAIRKLGWTNAADKLTAQDIVDLAYGAAKLEMDGTFQSASDATETNAEDPAKFSVDAAVKTNDTAVDSYIRKVAGRSGVQLKTNLQHQAKKLVRSMAFLHDLVDEYKGAMPAVADWYNAIQSTMARKRQLEADAELIAADALKLKNGTDKVNAFIADATTSQKWWKDVERQKDGNTVKVEADPELKERFRQLEPEERKIVEAVFAHGDKMLEIKYKLLKDLGLDGVMLGTGKLTGPYAPLKRFGNYVTVLKSQALVDAEMAEDAAKAEELKKDPANYVMSFFDTLGQARMFAEDHSGKYAFTDYGEKQVRLGEDLPTHNATLKRILDTIKVQNLPDEARVGMENLIREMYIQSLDEHHAATHGLTRKNTAGYETDMLRSFLSHARAEANFLAHLEYGGKVNNAFYEMQRQSRDRPGGKVVHRDALAALTRHYAENLNYKETPIQDRLMAFTSAWQLATSLGYHVANATQPVMTTVPRLASDFNDYAGAWKAVMDGYQTVKKTGVWGNIEIDKVLDSGLRTALQRAADLGVLDVGMDEDLTHFEQTHTGFGAVDKASKVAKTALHNMRKVSRAVETANRVAAATAAYNMAKKHGMAEQAAQDYAVRMLETTQGDFSRSGAPLLLKKLPKIMTQYKKFQFMMMALYAKAYRQAFHGEDAETRAIGRRMLAFKLFHTSMAAGALGLPMVNLAGPVLARMLAGDEEPPDLERDLRKIIGDETMADMLLHGPLHFMGMDAKLGEEKIFSILPYADWDFSSASGALKTAAGLAGPAVSLGLKFASGVEAFEKGDIYKGVEKFMPSGAANALKAFRVANEGYTLKNGDVMFAPDDINGAALAFDFFGLPSSDMKRMDWLRGQQYELTQFYKDRTKAIAKQYTDAVKDGDTDQASDAREAWIELQASKDRLRYLFGDSADELKRQPLSALMKYPKNQAEREQRLQRSVIGVQ